MSTRQNWEADIYIIPMFIRGRDIISAITQWKTRR